jgi:hypothetical protein
LKRAERLNDMTAADKLILLHDIEPAAGTVIGRLVDDLLNELLGRRP